MITPRKHMNLELSVINVSFFILEKIRKEREMELEQMILYLNMLLGEDVKIVFMNAMNFLFLIGKINFKKKEDKIIYIEK